MKLLIISGRSGSGKSITLHALEDLDYYCIDNLPVRLLPTLVETLSEEQQRIAVSIDARNLPEQLEQFEQVAKALEKSDYHYEIIYLDADDNTLLKRFSETRRKHPLHHFYSDLAEAIAYEKKLLQPIASKADLRIDSSNLTVHQLREIILSRIHKNHHDDLSLSFRSFAYKQGAPTDADLIFDVRCLANPYWHPKFRDQTGLQPDVINYLDQQPQAQEMLDSIISFIEKWLPAFKAENRKYLTVAIGCTGGQHRSVYVAEKLKDYFLTQHPHVSVKHRELP